MPESIPVPEPPPNPDLEMAQELRRRSLVAWMISLKVAVPSAAYYVADFFADRFMHLGDNDGLKHYIGEAASDIVPTALVLGGAAVAYLETRAFLLARRARQSPDGSAA